MRFLIFSYFFIVGFLPFRSEAQYYRAPSDSVEDNSPSMIFTAGLLKGGSLLGVEVEAEVIEGVGVFAGAGILGYSAGLAFHLHPDLQSSYFGIAYVNQGIGKLKFQGLVVPSFCYRASGGWAWEAGIGILTGEGPKADLVFKDEAPSIQPFISIGYFFW